MAGVNKAIIVGNLGKDPELRLTGADNSVCNLAVATSRRFEKNGQTVEETEWHRVVVWGRQARACAEHLRKGRQVYIEGRIQTKKWIDDQKQPRYSTEIVASVVQFLGSAPASSRKRDEGYGQRAERPQRGPRPEHYITEPPGGDW